MSVERNILIIDPTPFSGGSKIATENILRLLDPERTNIYVLTADSQSWGWSYLKRLSLYQPRWLATKSQGIPYFLRHFIIALNIIHARLRHGRFETCVGASGPGVDLAIYLVRPLLRFNIVQLIHGPVAQSRTIGRCLRIANEVHYLESARRSLVSALATISNDLENLPAPRFQVMENGLPDHNWPTRCQTDRAVIFWAASLLRWKGLETLIASLDNIDAQERPDTHICFIRPQNTTLPISNAPINMQAVHWHEDPEHLDDLRAKANIFVSTSKNEPFGLSILEAMASGHCVLIPADGAYWDHVLEDGVNCLKYYPEDPVDLAHKILLLKDNLSLLRKIGAAAAKLARSYRAETRYSKIKTALQTQPSISRKPVGIESGT